MNTEAIRWLDKNAGYPLCFFLTIHRRICGIFRKDTARYKRCSKILFIKLIEQGSTVLAYPALKKAQGYVGKENIFFLVFEENRPILNILDAVAPSNIIEISSKNLISFICSVIKALVKIRKEKIDTAIDMEFFSRASAALSYLSGADKRAGLHMFTSEGPRRGDLFTHRLIYNPYLHTKRLFVSLVEALNHNPPPDKVPMTFETPAIAECCPRFYPAEDEKKSLIRKIEGLKQTGLGKPIFILNPNIGDLLPIRRWPEENFIKLGKMILEEFPQTSIFITGTSQEKDKFDMLASRIEGALSLSGCTSLRELLTLYCIADILVTTDSGPAHFSALTPIKAVILFGPETPVLYGEKNKDKKVINSNLVCSPCVNVYNQRKSPCKTGMCLESIKVEDVYAKVKSFL